MARNRLAIVVLFGILALLVIAHAINSRIDLTTLGFAAGQSLRVEPRPMDAFSYLSVLISIILALGIAHLLSGLVRVVHNRTRTVFYWPTLVYAFILFVAIVQVWWADFHLSSHAHWTFAGFVSTLLGPSDLYLLCALLLPSADVPSADNMRTAYEHNRMWFFGALLALPALSFHQDYMLDGTFGSPVDVTMKLVFEALILAAMLFKAELVQKTVAAVGAILMWMYVELVFNTLH